MALYYKDKNNNVHTIYKDMQQNETILCINCSRENKPINNKQIIITNNNITYTTTTDVYGQVQLVVQPGIYTIILDDYSIEQEVIENTITTLDICAQYSIFGLLYNDQINDSVLCLQYCDDSLLVKDWDTENLFLNIKPCIIKNGQRQIYLNPNNLMITEQGQSIDITNPTIGDIMIEIPKIGIKFDTYQGQQRIQVTNNPNLLSEGFHYYAHTRETEGDKDYLYIGAFLGSIYENKLKSLGFNNILINNNSKTLRNYAQANGEGYDLLSFYPYVLLQILFLLKYKNLNSQEALGMGYTSLLNNKNILTGNTYNKGIDYGSQNGNEQIKFIGIEDLWGNNYCFIDGIYYDNNNNITTAFKNFNSTGVNYINHQNSITNRLDGYLTKSTFSAECGFLPLVTTNNSYMYYSDKIQRANNTGIVVGGQYNSSYDAGLFASYNESSITNMSARLMYL